jgi:hypothetical protein
MGRARMDERTKRASRPAGKQGGKVGKQENEHAESRLSKFGHEVSPAKAAPKHKFGIPAQRVLNPRVGQRYSEETAT